MDEIHPPKEVLEAVYPEVGKLVMQWPYLEQAIDALVTVAYQKAGGKAFQSKIETAFGPKVTFLCKCFDQLEPLKPHMKEAFDLLVKAEELHDLRSLFVHGTVSAYDRKTKQLKFLRLSVNKPEKIHEYRFEYMSVAQIIEAGDELLRTALSAQAFAKRLVDEIG